MSIYRNVQAIIEDIRALQPKQEVKILAATKYADEAVIRELYQAGIRIIGENRVDELLKKQEILKDLDLSWHFIGSLQSRKVKRVINRIDALHSLDRLKLADLIEKYRETPLDVFVQVNVSGEPTKHGLSVDEVLPFVQHLASYQKIRVIGLMTMAPFTDDETRIRQTFQTLRALQERVQALSIPNCPCQELSMGMSNDYKIAIEEGATIIRIGSKLFQ